MCGGSFLEIFGLTVLPEMCSDALNLTVVLLFRPLCAFHGRKDVL